LPFAATNFHDPPPTACDLRDSSARRDATTGCRHRLCRMATNPMSTSAGTQQKITYATMSSDRLADLHRELDGAIESVSKTFGKRYPLMVAGREVYSAGEFDDRSPIDTRVLLGTFQQGSREQVREAIAAARAACRAWSATRWQERVALLKKVADGIR